MVKHLELYLLDVIKGRRKGFVASLLKVVLRGLSWLFKAGVRLRNWAFDKELVCRHYPPVPVVISVGNIVAGGTGKTPVTLMLAREFYDRYQIAILTRGYRSQAEKQSLPVALSIGEGPIHHADYCGDEPLLLARNLPKASVYVGKDRHKASIMAAKAGAQLIILDDGMQHRALARDLEVVVMDVRDPFGQGYFLPRGFLREDASSLDRADLIILNHAFDLERYHSIKQQVMRYTKAPVVATRMEVAQIIHLNGETLESIKGKRVGIFCGIAHPEYFQATVENLGAIIVTQYYVPDHMATDFGDLKAFASDSEQQGAELLVCTEKDRVKLGDSLALNLPVVWLRTELVLVDGNEEWKTFVTQVKSDLDHKI